MKAQGRLFNHINIGDNVYVNLSGADNVAFLCYLAGAAGDTYTLTEAKDSGGVTSKVLPAITRYYTSDGVGGAWTEQTQAAGSTVVTTATTAQNGMVVEVSASSLDDGYKYLKLASTGAGLVTVLLTDLRFQRRPTLLPSVIA